MRLVDLHDQPTGVSAVEHQASVRARFSMTAERVGLRIWSPGERIAREGLRLLIGVATYSRAELSLLDEVADRLPKSHFAIRVDVFDVATCDTQADFSQYIPALDRVLQTPIVGVWNNGVLVRCGTGHDSVSILEQYVGPLSWPYDK